MANLYISRKIFYVNQLCQKKIKKKEIGDFLNKIIEENFS